MFEASMWFLLDPIGRQMFWVVESLIITVGLWCIYYTFREEK
jgi:hypothetical protein